MKRRPYSFVIYDIAIIKVGRSKSFVNNKIDLGKRFRNLRKTPLVLLVFLRIMFFKCKWSVKHNSNMFLKCGLGTSTVIEK